MYASISVLIVLVLVVKMLLCIGIDLLKKFEIHKYKERE